MNKTLFHDLKFIQGLLTRDHIHRRLRKWSLLSEEELTQMWISTKDPRLEKWIECQKECFVAHRTIYSETMGRETWVPVKQTAIKMLFMRPHIEELLSEFHGRIVLAGGSVFSAVSGFVRGSQDFDFFFVDPMVEQNGNPKDYTNLLLKVSTFLSSKWLYSDPEKQRRNVYILRSEHVTTIRLIGDNEDHKYQFIHRVYPSIGSILGGFDLGPSMLAFDGKNILATEFGAWCSFAYCIILDTSRRSTSYEYRLRKYSDKCHIIFPGLPAELVCEEAVRNWLEEDHVISILKHNLKANGFQIGGDFPYYLEKGSEGEFITEEHHKVIRKMRKLADRLGWRIANPDDIVLSPFEDPVKGVDDPEEMKRTLERIAYEKGYMFYLHDFLEYLKDGTNEGGFLIERIKTFKLPFLAINLETEKRWSVGPCNLSIVKNDYSDNPIWPSYAGVMNITNLALGRISYVNSILVLASPDAPLMNAEDAYINISEIMSFIGTTRRTVKNVAEIEAKIHESFYNPLFGNIEAALQLRLDFVEGLSKGKELKERLFSLFGKASEKICLNRQEKFVASWNYQQIENLRKSLFLGLEEVRRRLQNDPWILKNPGRQWTSSVNPVMANPREWYGPSYRSFKIGCEEIETTLRLGRRSPDSPFYRMDVNIFNMILRLVVWENSFL